VHRHTVGRPESPRPAGAGHLATSIARPAACPRRPNSSASVDPVNTPSARPVGRARRHRLRKRQPTRMLARRRYPTIQGILTNGHAVRRNFQPCPPHTRETSPAPDRSDRRQRRFALMRRNQPLAPHPRVATPRREPTNATPTGSRWPNHQNSQPRMPALNITPLGPVTEAG